MVSAASKAASPPWTAKNGPTVRTQFYQQVLGCQILSSRVKPSLALEWVGPGKGKVSASLRLPARLPTFYDTGFFDILFPEALPNRSGCGITILEARRVPSQAPPARPRALEGRKQRWNDLTQNYVFKHGFLQGL